MAFSLQFDALQVTSGQTSAIGDISDYQQRIVQFCKDYQEGTPTFKLQTSGSTGVPKLITVTRDQMRTSALATIGALGLTSDDCALVCINTDYIGGKMMLVRAMEAHMQVVLQTPEGIPAISNEQAIDFIALVPLQVQRLLASSSGRRFLNRCRIVIIGGAALEPRIAAQLQTLNNRCYHTFGMTETVSHIALRALTGKDQSSSYQVLPGVTIAQDERGCLIVEGPMTDYRKIISNDLVEVVDNQHFRWLGRWDQVINSGGYKIYPPKVEHQVDKALMQLGLTHQGLITSSPDAEMGQKGVLILEGPQLSITIESKLWEYLKDSLHPYEIPKELYYQLEFPRTATNKVDLLVLKKRLGLS